MRTVESLVERVARGMRGRQLPRKDSGAENCPDDYIIMARAKWPKKTALHWANAAGRKSATVAKAWLRGHISADGKLAIRDLFR